MGCYLDLANIVVKCMFAKAVGEQFLNIKAVDTFFVCICFAREIFLQLWVKETRCRVLAQHDKGGSSNPSLQSPA